MADNLRKTILCLERETLIHTYPARILVSFRHPPIEPLDNVYHWPQFPLSGIDGMTVILILVTENVVDTKK